MSFYHNGAFCAVRQRHIPCRAAMAPHVSRGVWARSVPSNGHCACRLRRVRNQTQVLWRRGEPREADKRIALQGARSEILRHELRTVANGSMFAVLLPSHGREAVHQVLKVVDFGGPWIDGRHCPPVFHQQPVCSVAMHDASMHGARKLQRDHFADLGPTLAVQISAPSADDGVARGLDVKPRRRARQIGHQACAFRWVSLQR